MMKRQIHYAIAVLSLTTIVTVPSLHASTARHGRRARFLPVIVPSQTEARSLNERRNHLSPDKMYVASLQHGDGDVWDLTIRRSRSRQRLVRADDVHGLAWVPGHHHRLVVATCGLYGEARLALWDGGKHWRVLHPVKRPYEECFWLDGVSADGESILY